MAAKERTEDNKWSERQLKIKCFDSEMILSELDWEEITSYGQKYFREMNNHLCKVSAM